MKTKFLAIFALAALLVACDNKNVEEPQNAPSNKVTLRFAVPSAQPNQVCARNISGTIDGNFGEYTTSIAWSWKRTDELIVSGKDKNNQDFSEIFTYQKVESGIAYFTGTFPDAFDQENGTFDVSYSKADAPQKNQIIEAEAHIADGSMFFEAKGCKLSDDVILLYPQWSVLEINVSAIHDVWVGAEATKIDETDIQKVTATLQSVKVYALTESREKDETFAPYVVNLNYDEDSRKVVGTQGSRSINLPVVIFDKFEHGIMIETIFIDASLTLKGEAAEHWVYPSPEKTTFTFKSVDQEIDFTLLDNETNTYPGKFITVSPALQWHRTAK